MAKFDEMMINFLMVGLVVLGIFAFGIGFQSENDINNKFIDDPLMNSTFASLENDLAGLRDTSQDQRTVFESEKPTEGIGTILLFSIVKSGQVFNNMIVGVFNLLIRLPVSVLGVSESVASVLSTIVIILGMLGLWAIYKLGG